MSLEKQQGRLIVSTASSFPCNDDKNPHLKCRAIKRVRHLSHVSCQHERESWGEGKGEKWTEDGKMWEVMEVKENQALTKWQLICNDSRMDHSVKEMLQVVKRWSLSVVTIRVAASVISAYDQNDLFAYQNQTQDKRDGPVWEGDMTSKKTSCPYYNLTSKWLFP